jgi:hypothetical protein
MGIEPKKNEIEDLRMIDERKEEEAEVTEAEFYGWDAKEEINFSVFGRGAEEEPID